jgi:hypothetical protein
MKMNVFDECWYLIQNEKEWEDICPEATTAPTEYPVSVQLLDTSDGLLFSVLPAELGSFLWNNPFEIDYIPDFDYDDDDEDEEEYH